MIDPRIERFRNAASDMKDGRFPVTIETGADDEIGRLGKALVELGKAFERNSREINIVSRITQRINAGLVLDEILDHVFDSFAELIPYDRIGFALIEEEGKLVRARWARSRLPDMRIPRGYAAPLHGSSLGQIIDTGRPRIIDDLQAHLLANPKSESTRLIVEEGMRSSLTCPLLAMGKPVGFVFFSSVLPGTYSGAHVELFQQIAGQVAIIVEKGRLYQELVDLNQIRNRFLGIAAHDLRNPLGIVRGYAEMFLDGFFGSLTPEQQKHIEKIKVSCTNMVQMVNDLLDISAIEAGKVDLHPEPVDIPSFLTAFQSSHAVLARPKNIEIRLDVAADMPPVTMDPVRITQALDNLVSNAIKFSHPGTAVTVRAAQSDGKAVFAVEDEGQGIPGNELSRIFSEFVRTSVKPTAGEKCTGLGLAIVKRIVECHGGRVWVESEVGRGTKLSFEIPMEGPPSPPSCQGDRISF